MSRHRATGRQGRRSGQAIAASPRSEEPAARSLTEAAPAARDWPFVVNAGTLETFYGGWWNLGAGEAAALGLSAVWRCVTLIADAISGRDWHEWRGDEELPPSRLVRRPAASMTRRRWTWRVVASLMLYNRAPLWMVGDLDNEGVPWSLLPIPPDAVQPEEPIDELGIREPTHYRVGRELVSAEELYIIHRAELPTTAPHHAALLRLARRVFGQAIAADAGATRYWESGGAPTTVLSSEQELDKTQADAIAARWLSRRAMGPDYPAVLGKGAHAEPFGADPTRESTVEARDKLVADVGRLFGVGSRLLNAPANDSSTYANTESDSLDLIRFTLAGYSDPIADAISDLLPGDYLLGRRVTIGLEELTRAEQKSRYEAWAIALGGRPFMTPAEVRRLEKLPPDPSLDKQPTPPALAAAALSPAAPPAPGHDAEAEASRDSEGATAGAPGPGASEEVTA